MEEIKGLLKTLKDKKADIKIVMDDLVTGIETLLSTITIALQDERESN